MAIWIHLGFVIKLDLPVLYQTLDLMLAPGKSNDWPAWHGEGLQCYSHRLLHSHLYRSCTRANSGL